jgi:predicted RNA binding protein YcfA (HicA-like mRNA interferase family)
VKSFRRAVERLLRAAECRRERSGKGSHAIWRSPVNDRSFSVPATIKSRHTANEILKQAGLPKAF